MPTDAEHADKYRESRALLNGPLRGAGAWEATAAFYAAVHLVERLAAADGIHHSRHVGAASRAGYLARHADHVVIAPALAALLSASMVARYESPAAFAAAFPGDTVEAMLIGKMLLAIEEHVTARLGGL